MVYPENFEHKIGFDRVKSQIKALCVTQKATEKLAEASFLTNIEEIRKLLEETFEMRNVLMMENGLPDGSFVDMDDFLKKAAVQGAFLEGAGRCARIGGCEEMVSVDVGICCGEN